MKSITSKLSEFDLKQKKVLLRSDLNVPINSGKIIDDFRLQASKPTIDVILKKGGKIFLVTHIGRPKNKEINLSTKQLIPWFEQNGYHVSFVDTIEKADNLLSQDTNFVLFENIRFFPEEKAGDSNFAKKLAGIADYYIEDAFATLHRNDASITQVPTFFDGNHKTIGLLVEKELQALSILTDNPQKPFVLVLGGGKVETKLPLIEHLLNKVSHILLGPALVFTFLKALGKKTGISLVQEDQGKIAYEIVQQAAKKNVSLLFPVDYLIAKESKNGELSIVESEEFPANGVGISIGPKTIELYCNEIAHAKTIFFNCAMGYADRPETLNATKKLLAAIAESNEFSVVGGGDSVSIARSAGLQESINFLSSGGGASLALLSGQKLPGLDVLM